MVEACAKRADGCAGAGLPGVGIEYVDYPGGVIMLGVAILGVEGKILELLGAVETGECCCDCRVCSRLCDAE